MKAIRVNLLLAFIFLSHFQGFSQPIWMSALPNGTPGNPYISGTNPTSLNARYGINEPGTVYLIVYDYNRPLDASITPDFIKTEALAGASGSKVFTAVLTVLPGQINTSIGLSISGLQGSTYHTQFWVAENTTPTLQAAAVRSNGTTKPCPAINLAFGYVSPNECVNQGSTLELSLIPVGANPDAHGIYVGTTYHIIWGDGDVLDWNSTSVDLVPPAALLQHTYSGPANCTYEVIIKVTSSCSPLVVKNFGTKIVIHGRDILDDGDGDLLIEENGTGITGTIEVCEGNSHIITLRDISTWNCQNPTWLDLSPAPPNDAPRTIQWIYGENDGGAVQNTIGTAMGTGITDPVVIDGIHNATTADGYVGDAVIDITSTGELSKQIVIPATCREGEYFDVYFRNWNKCNLYPGKPPVITHIRILVIESPDMPIAPDVTICYTGNIALSELSASHGVVAGNQFTWYSNPDKTGFLAIGDTYNPGVTTAGTYTYYVADGQTSGNLCQGPAKQVVLTINPIPDTPTISRDNPDFCFDGTSSIILTANPLSPPAVSGYQWYRNTVAVVGATNSTITLSTVAQSGDYTCRTFGIASTNCPSLLSNQITVNIWALATVTAQPGNPTVCQGSNTTFSITAGGAASNIRWQRRIGAGAWVDITAGTTPNDGCTYSNYTTNTLTITSAAAGMNAYQYRARLTTTAGSCITYSNAGTLTVNPTANITTQPSNVTVCELSNTSFSVVASVAGPSTITGYQWQRRPGSGGYTNITGPATPNDGGTYGGYSTATLTITSAAAGMNNYTYRVIITTTGGCTITSTARTLTVNQLADITAHPANRAICAGTNTTFSVTNDGTPAVTAHQWQRRIGAGAWVNITGGTTPNDGCTYSNWTTGTLGLAGVPAGMNTNTYRCILTTAGGCTITSNTGLLTVHTIPIDRVVSAADSWLCYNTGTSINLTSSEVGSVYQLRIGVTDVGPTQNGNGANRVFPTENLTATSIFNINAAKTTTIGASTLTCYRQMTNTPTVNVNPNLTITNLTHPDICLDGTIDLPSATPAGGSTNYTYAWTGTGGYTNNGQDPALFSPTSGTGAYSYTVTVTDEGFRTASSDNTVCTVDDAVQFTVNPLPVIGMAVSDPMICAGQSATITIANTVVGTNYQLRLDADDSNVGASVAGNGGNRTFTVSPASTTPYNILATIVATGCDNEVTDKSTVTVNPNPSPLISGLNNVCSGATLVAYSTPLVGANTYVWNISGGVISGGAGTNAITVTWGAPGGGWVRVTETMAVTGCQVTTANYNITFNPGPPVAAPALTSGASELCKDGTLNINVSDVATASTYEWDYSWVPGFSNAITATSDNSINLLGLAAGTYTVSVRGVNGCGPGPWMPVHSFDINDIPDLSPLGGALCSDVASGITLAITNFNVTYCSGITYNITAINNGGLTASAGAPAAGNGLAANVMADDAWTNRTAANVNVVYTVVPVSVQGCTGNPENITLTVSPEPDLNNLNKTVCSDGTIGVTLTDVHSLANSFEIVSITPQAGLVTTIGNATTGAGKAANAIVNDRWTNKTGGSLTVTYAVIPRIAAGCIGDQEDVVLTVSPEPDLNNLNKTICSDEITGITLSDFHSLANSFEIMSISPQAGLVTTAGNSTTGAGKPANSILDDKWTNRTANPLNVTYVIIPRLAGGCIGDAESVVVTISPEPDLSPLGSTVCSDEVTGIIFSDVHGIANSYEIVSITPQAGLVSTAGNATTGAGKAANAIQNDKWTNKTPGSRIVTYVVRPRIAAGCIGDQEDVVVTVNPEPDLSALNTTVCSDATTSVTLTDVHSLANSYEIVSITPQAGLVTTAGNATTGAGKAANAIVNDRWTNKTAGLLTVTYAIIPRIAAGCIGDQENVVVTISTEPDLSPLSSTVCSDAVTGITMSDVHGIANSFELVSITPQAGLVAGGSNSTTGAGKLASAISNDTWTNKTAAALTVTYAIIPSIGAGCTGDQENVVVTVNPEPDLSPLSSTVCSDAVTGITLSDVLGLANSFEIVSITPTGGITGAAGNATTGTGKLAGAITNDTWTNKTAINQTVTYVIVPRIDAGCIGDLENVVVTVRPEPDLNNLNTTICSEESTGVTLADVHSLGNSFEIVSIIPQAGLVPAAGNATAGPGKAANAILNDRFNNKTAGALTVTYAIIPRIASGCIGNQENVVITINPEPDLADLNKTICSDIITGIILSDVHGIANRFNIISIIPGAGLVAGATNASAGADQLSNAIFNDKWTNSTSGSLTVTYRVIPRISSGCSGDQEDIVVTVSPEPDLSDLNTTICNDTETGVILSDVAGLANWFNIVSITADPGLTAAAGNATTGNDQLANSIATDVWTNSTTGSLTVTYVIVPSINGICFGDPENVVITIRPPIRGGNITGGAAVCYNTDAPGITNMVPASGGDGAIVYSWYYNENLAAAPNDPGWILIAGATGSDYDPGTLINPAKFIRRAIDGSCTATASSNMVTFTIKPLPVTSAITGEIKLCDDAVNKIYQVVNSAGSTYDWSVPAGLLNITYDDDLFFIMVDAVDDASGTGPVQVIETSSLGCLGAPVTLNVTVAPVLPGEDITGPAVVCQGAVDVSFSIPDRAGSTYSWVVPAGASISNDPGSHEIFVSFTLANPLTSISVVETTAGGCTTVHNPKTITVSPLPAMYNVTAPSYYCFGAGGVTVTLSNSQAGVNYQLLKNAVPEGGIVAGNGSPLSWNGMTAGIYSVRATFAAAPFCNILMNGNPSVEENLPLIINDIIITEPTCFGASNGSIVIDASGGYPPATSLMYSINGGTTFQSSATFTGISAGTYNIMVRDSRNCTVVAPPEVVTQPVVLEVSSIGVTNAITCFGSADGSVRVTATGGTGSYAYQWYFDAALTIPLAGQTNDEATGVPAGTYWVKVTDLNGCFVSASITIIQPAQLTATAVVTSNYNGSQISCNGSSDAVIEVSAMGGTGIKSYYLNEMPLNITGAASGIFTGVGPGNYTVKVTDINLCETTTAAVIVTEPAQVTATSAITSNYNGSHISCSGASDGRITVTASGGTGTLEFHLDEDPSNITGLNTGIFTGLGGGTYHVTVKDDNNCEVTTAPVTVTEPAVVTASATVTSDYHGSDISCSTASDAVITVAAGGGTGALTYSIIESPGNLTGMATGIFTGVGAGTYTIRVTDLNGCNIVTPQVIVIAPTPVTATGTVTSDYNGSHISCFGEDDGEITISAAGGTGVLTYVLNQDPANVTGAASGVFTNLVAGNYTVTVTDENGCMVITAGITVNNPLVINASATVTSNYNGSQISCNGADDAIITATAAGGTGSKTYELIEDPLNITGAVTGIFTGLGPGSYTVRVRDANFCENITAAVTVTEPAEVTAIASVTSNYFGSQLTCNGASDGIITVTSNGGTGARTYSLAELPGNTTGELSGVFTGLLAGTYTVNVADKNGCLAVAAPVTIIPPPVLTLSVNVTTDYNGQDISCFGASDGRALATAGGGTSMYFYAWYSDAAMTVPIGQLTPDAINLAAGDYFVRVIDINGCTITGGVILTQPSAPDATITSQTNILCYGSTTGSVTVEAVAGTGTAPYQYSINGGSTWHPTGTFTNLAASLYTVLARDLNGCVKMVPVTITQPSQLTAAVTSIANVTCNGAGDGTVTVTATAGSGTAPYMYSINGGTDWFNSGTFTSLAGGTYNISVIDAGNCTIAVPALITEPPLLQLTSTPDVLLDCFDDKDGTGTFYAAGGNPGYTFAEEVNTSGATFAVAGFNFQSFFNAGEGSVSVRVTDSKGCSQVAMITFTQPAVLIPGSIESDQVICSGSAPLEITQVTSATGGPGVYNYQWQYSTSATGTFFNVAGANMFQYTPPANATSTLYYRRMVSSGICAPAYSNAVEIKVNPLPIAILSGNATVCPGESAIIRVNVPSGLPPFELELENHGVITGYTSDADITVTPAATTIYRLLRVRDANGCEISGASSNLIGMATVTVRELPLISTSPVDKTICEYGATSFSVAATGSDLMYQWYVDKGTGFELLPDGGVYFGSTSPTLNIFGGNRSQNGYVFHVVVTGCSTSVTSSDATLTVNTSPEIVIQPVESTVCSTANTSFTVTANGTGLTYQWQVNQGSGFSPVADGGVYSGANTATLSLTGVPGSYSNYIYRVIVSGTCQSPAYSNFVMLRVIAPPVVTLNPAGKAVCEASGSVYFTANGSGMVDSLRWQINNGGIWTDIYDNGVYSGTNMQQLSFLNPPASFNGREYRLALKAACTTVYTAAATLTVNSNPVITFTEDPLPVCGNVAETMMPVITGGSGTWTQHTWSGDISPLNTTNIQNPVFRTPASGLYNLDYRIRDNNGCFGTATVAVNVDSPDANFNYTIAAGNNCTPLTVSFTKDMTGIASFEWDFGNGSAVNTTTANPEHVYTNSTPATVQYHTVKLTVYSAGGCMAEKTMDIMVTPAIDATFTANKTVVCSGEPISFSTLPGASNYAWNYGDGTGGAGTNVTNHTYTNSGSTDLPVTITLTTTSFYGCMDTETLDIVVKPRPIPQFTPSPVRSYHIDGGNPVTFTNETNPGTWTWAWDFGDGSASTEQNPSHTYTAIGTFKVILEVTNGTCSAEITHQVSIDPIPPVADFDSIPSGCEPLVMNLNNTSLHVDIPGTTYKWDFGDGGTSVAKNPVYTFFDPGIYRVELTVTGPAGDYSIHSQAVHVYPTPIASFDVAPKLVFVNDEKVRAFNLSQGADYYVWEWGDGDTSKTKEPFHKYMESGVYDISLSAYKDNGNGNICYDKYTMSPGVTVEPAGDLRFASVFRPNLTGPEEIIDLPTGEKIDQFFFPPIRERVINYKLQIFNRLGVLIFESHDINIPWNGYYKGQLCPQGVYVWFVEGKYSNGQVFKKVGDITLLH